MIAAFTAFCLRLRGSYLHAIIGVATDPHSGRCEYRSALDLNPDVFGKFLTPIDERKPRAYRRVGLVSSITTVARRNRCAPCEVLFSRLWRSSSVFKVVAEFFRENRANRAADRERATAWLWRH